MGAFRWGFLGRDLSEGQFRSPIRPQSRKAALAVAGAMVLSGLVTLDAAAAGPRKPPLTSDLQETPSVPGEPVKPKPAPPPGESQRNAWTGAPNSVWPAAGSGELDLSATVPAQGKSGAQAQEARTAAAPGTAAQVGSLPVKIAANPTPGSSTPPAAKSAGAPAVDAANAPAKVRVDLGDHAAAQRAGIDGVLLGVKRVDGAATSTPVAVELDYTSFKGMYGGAWASRLQFVGLPACALTTPDLPECRIQTSVQFRNDVAASTLTAHIDAAATNTAAADSQARTAAAPTGGMVLAAVAAPEGPKGDYKATTLAPSGSWQGGGPAGDFSWSYPLELPTSLGGPGPNLALGYSSSSVDGRTSASQAQGSWIGDGWDMGASFIERTFPSCADDKKPGSGFNNPQADTGDVCQAPPVVAMSLNGGSTQLVLNDNPNDRVWRPQSDDGSKVELLRGAPNGDKEGEYWVVTTMDGTKYYFGQNQLPGWSNGKPVTKSAWTMPVVGNHPGEDCYTASFANSFCDQAYRWNLDLVVDPRGNAMSHYYETELNSYGSNVQPDGTSTNRQYVRGGWLARSEYGLRADNLYAPAPAWVDFTVAERCLPLAGVNCAPEALTKDTAKNWPDVPFDQNCNVGEDCKDRYAATFWSRKRLVDITTRIRVGGQVRDVDSWVLTHDFPAAGDGSDRALWLASIQRTGKNGTTPGISTPPVQFVGKQLPNRVDNNGDGSPPYFRYRMEAIHTETGQSIGVTYEATECSTVAPVKLPAPENNGMRCFPVRMELTNPSDPDAPPTYKFDWFHKHVVKQIRDEDRNNNSPSKVTNYEYVGTPAWAFDDDNELAKPELRTWSQWRGYERVRTRTGDPAEDRPSLVENLYFRGMDGDKQPNGGRRSVEIVDSEGGRIRDTELFSGQVRETLYYDGDGGPLVSATVFTPWLSDPTASRAREGIDPQEARVQQTVKVAARTALSDGRGWRRTETHNTFDNRGLQLTNSNLGDIATPADDSCTRITYAPITGLHILNLVSRVETVSKACDTPTVRPDDVVSDQLAYYDAVGNSTGGAVLDRYEGATPKYESNGTITVDEYGRPKVTTDIYGVTTTNTYVPAAGEIVSKVETVNGLGHKTTIEVDPARGVPLAETDTNGRKSVMQYDPLGRMTKVWSPDRDPNSMSPDAEFEYTVRTDGPVVTTTRKLNNQSQYLTSYDIYDGMLRHRQTQTQAHGSGRLITSTFYNTRGEVEKQDAAHWNNDSGPVPELWSSSGAQIPASTVTEYDGLGRPVATVAQSMGAETHRTTTTYGGDWTAVDPPKGTTPTKAYVDALGRKTELQQFKGDAPTGDFDKTRYEYDNRGQLSKVIDPTGLEWTYKYDLRGRLVETVDPDRGTTTQTYDTGSRLLTTTDGRGKTIAYAYDVLGRPTATHEGTLQGPKLTQQTYDTLPGAVGLPVSSSRFVNGNEYKQEVTAYNTEYQATGNKITIPASEGKLAGTYQYSSGYGVTGLPEWTAHPAAGGLSGERVSTEYNGYDMPTRLALFGATIAADVNYTPLGRVSRTITGPKDKQVQTSYEYDAHSGRTTRVTNDRDTAPQRINDVRYEYDESGNILKISDAEGPNPTAATTDTQCFAYDYVQRMTNAWSATDDCAAKPGDAGTNGGRPMVGGPDAYWTSYTYGTTGNRLTEVQHDPAGNTTADVTRNYAYPQGAGAKTHQLSSVTTTGPGGSRVENFTYDGVGNTTSRTVGSDTQTLDWDAEGRLTKAVKAGKATEFVYDASGARLIRRDPDSTTLYLPGTELKLTTATNKVTATRTYSHPAGPTMVRTNESGTIKNSYLLADHNGTANTAIDVSTQSVTRRKSTPFGDARGAQPSVWPGEKGYVGGTIDKSTSLVHLGAREYDPTIGRFISVDPIMDNTDPQQMQAYSYANNSPITLSDPSGLCAFTKCMGLGSMSDPAPKISNEEQFVKNAGPPPAAPPASQISQADVDRARFLANQSKMDLAAQVAKEVLKDMSGYNDIMSCIGGSVGSCAMLALEAAMMFASKAKKIFKALKKVKKAIEKWGEDVAWARGIVRQADDAAAAQAKYADDLAAYNKSYDEGLAAAKKADADEAAAAAKRSEEEAAAAAKADAGGDTASSSCALPGNSFVPGTPVLLADGTTKPIEQIQLGDEVLATDPETGKSEPRPVVATVIGQGYKHLVKITVDTDGDQGSQLDTVTATDGHPFWVEDLRDWVPAKDLTAGSWLRTSAGTHVQVTAVQAWKQPHQVHNLGIADIHTYQVGAGASSVLVHNCGSGGTPAIGGDYTEEAVQGRADEWAAHAQQSTTLTRDHRRLIDRVLSDSSYPQRQTTNSQNQHVPDFFMNRSNSRDWRSWRNSPIYDMEGMGIYGSQVRIMVHHTTGEIAWFPIVGGAHNYSTPYYYKYGRR